MMKPLLLTSTPERPTPEPPSPRTDFLELARLLDAEVSYPLNGGGLLAKVEKQTASDLRQAWCASRRRDVSVFVSLSEKVGLPLAFLGTGNVPHVLLAHNLTSPRKRSLQKKFRYLNRFTRILVLCRTQERYLREEVGLPAGRVRFLYDKVDAEFFDPARVSESLKPRTALSVGRERRDYATLAAAAQLLPDVCFTVVASSPWSRQSGAGADTGFSENVTELRGLPWGELRSLYARSAVVVVPLEAGTEYAAGVNAVLEAMASGRPVIVSATPGIADYVENGVSARVVTAGEPVALAEAIREVLRDIPFAESLGTQARRIIANGRNMNSYLGEFVKAIREVAR